VSAAHLMLIQRGLQPIEVKEHKSILKFEITKKTVARKEIMHFLAPAERLRRSWDTHHGSP